MREGDFHRCVLILHPNSSIELDWSVWCVTLKLPTPGGTFLSPLENFKVLDNGITLSYRNIISSLYAISTQADDLGSDQQAQTPEFSTRDQIEWPRTTYPKCTANHQIEPF